MGELLANVESMSATAAVALVAAHLVAQRVVVGLHLAEVDETDALAARQHSDFARTQLVLADGVEGHGFGAIWICLRKISRLNRQSIDQCYFDFTFNVKCQKQKELKMTFLK